METEVRRQRWLETSIKDESSALDCGAIEEEEEEEEEEGEE